MKFLRLFILICMGLLGTAFAPDETVNGFYQTGLKFYNAKDYDHAIRYFNETLRLDPNNAQAFQGRANCYYSRGQYKDALADYQKAIFHNPSDSKLAAFVEQVKAKVKSLPDKSVAMPPPLPGNGMVDFKKDVSPILKNSCFACHVSDNDISTPVSDSVFEHRRQKEILNGIDSFPMGGQFPFPDDRPPLKQLDKMEKMIVKLRMPPEAQEKFHLGTPLSDVDRQLLLDWVAQTRKTLQP
jgi:tetratricopeptide (TPR) repeat protein